MQVKINGSERAVEAGTIASLLLELGIDAGRVAVELNLAIICQADFSRTPLAAGDSIEIVQFVGGG